MSDFQTIISKITVTENHDWGRRYVLDYRFEMRDGSAVGLQRWGSNVNKLDVPPEPTEHSKTLALQDVPLVVLKELYIALNPTHPDPADPTKKVHYTSWPYPDRLNRYAPVPTNLEDAAMLTIFGETTGKEINEMHHWADAHVLFESKSRRIALEVSKELTHDGEPPFRWDTCRILREEAGMLGGTWYTMEFVKDGFPPDTRYASLPIERGQGYNYGDPYYLFARVYEETAEFAKGTLHVNDTAAEVEADLDGRTESGCGHNDYDSYDECL